jgi:hypothetical protein
VEFDQNIIESRLWPAGAGQGAASESESMPKFASSISMMRRSGKNAIVGAAAIVAVALLAAV